MKRLFNALPNAITCLNILMGCVASVTLIQGNYKLSILAVLIGLFADFADGFVARLLKVQSELGKQLDSLADMITFGFYPGLIAYTILQELLPQGDSLLFQGLPFLGFLITVSSGIRLAAFNISSNQSSEFIGLPTPANTVIWLTYPLLRSQDESGMSVIAELLNWQWIVLLIFLTSFLLNSKIRLLALKFSDFKFTNNWDKYLLLISSVVLMYIFGLFSGPFIITLYLLISLIKTTIK